MAGTPGKFTTGSTMRHVVVMTVTASAGLMFMFLVDFATLFWVGQLGVERYVAALGYVATVQYFTISVGIGLAIAGTALVSRALGQGDTAKARNLAMGAMALTIIVQGGISTVVLLARDPLLMLVGAEGETLGYASDFLLITLPTLALMAVGMMAGAVLRASGEAYHAMMVTVLSGATAFVIDPILILNSDVVLGVQLPFVFGLGWGLDGAAWGMVAARVIMACVGLWYVIRRHNLIARYSAHCLAITVKPFMLIAGPAIATQLSTPAGNAILTAQISQFGDSAVAGWTVISRLTVLGFGGIFALSGAIGGIIGQNNGAGLMGRVKSAYRDALVFCAGYTAVVWALLWVSTPAVIAGFSLTTEGAEVLRAFTGIAAGSFIFTGAIFVANAAFNNLGRPLWSTGVNWLRDGILMYPVAVLAVAGFAAPGVVYGQAAASVIVGVIATLIAWRYIDRISTVPSATPA
ncbi:MAG: MATE family efflux transporter [Pseudomonadota bacterium]